MESKFFKFLLKYNGKWVVNVIKQLTVGVGRMNVESIINCRIIL